MDRIKKQIINIVTSENAGLKFNLITFSFNDKNAHLEFEKHITENDNKLGFYILI